MILTPKYSIGDIVYCISTFQAQKWHPCPDCKGARKWAAQSPAGAEFTFACPRCAGSYQSYRDISLSYTAHVSSVATLTIGSVRTDTADEKCPIDYMCVETGVGSGTIYDETGLFLIREDADKAAQALADKRNAETDWIVEQFDASFRISDYELDNAVLDMAQKMRTANTISVEILFEELEDCMDMVEVREVIKKFEFK